MDPGGWPLVGREDDLRRTREALARGRGALLVGPAGVGRTRLARAAVEPDGRPVRWFGGGRYLATVPFGAFGSPASDVREVHQALALADDAVVVVDDAHWLDPASLALTEHLLVHTETTVLLVARWAAAGTAAVDDLAARRGLARLDVAPLPRSSMRELRRRVAPERGDEDGRRDEDACVGRPRLLAAVLDGEDREAVRARVVAEELDVRTDDERTVLELVAVAGSVPIDLLEAVGDGEALATLERRGVLVASPAAAGWSVAFVEPLHRRTVRAGLGPASVRLRARQALGSGPAVPPDGPVARIRRAVLHLELGDRSDPALLGSAAGDLLMAANDPRAAVPGTLAGDLDLAADLAEAALSGGGGFDAAEVLVRIESHRLDSRRLAAALRRLTELATTDHLRARAAFVSAAVDILNDADPERAYQEVMVSVTGDDEASRAARRMLAAVVVLVAMATGRITEAVARGEEVLADPLATRAERLALAGPLVLVMAASGRTTDALALADRLVADVRPGDDPTALGGLMGARIGALASAGRYAEGGQLAEQAVGVAQVLGGDAGVAMASLALSFCLHVQGRLADAAAAAERSLAMEPAGLGRRPAAALLTRARSHLGDRAGAEEALAVLDAVPSVFAYQAMEHERARAWVLHDRGDLAGARRVLRAAAAQEAAESPPVAANALFDLARMGDGSGAEDLAALANRTQDPATPIYAAHARALAADDGRALEAVADRHAELGAFLFAAEAAAQAAGVHDRARRGADAARAAARSAAWAERCQGAKTPALRRPPTDLSGLTRREREVAELAAEGLSDRAIAGRLSLSVRTVESHLHRCYAKLAVTNRAELRALLHVSP